VWAADCEKPYTTDDLLNDLVVAEANLLSEDAAAAKAVATKMQTGFACLNDTLPTILIGRVYRAVAGGLYVGGDEARGKQWMLTAIEVDGAYTYGVEDLGPNHPVRLAFDELKKVPQGDAIALDGGKVFIEGTFLLDGRGLSSPEARLERPHLLQKSGESVEAWVIEGNAFPEVVLVDDGAAAVAAGAGAAAAGKKVKEPKGPKPEKAAKPEKTAKTKGSTAASDGVMVVQRKRPPEKIPLIVGGSAVIIGAGVLYALSHISYGKFEDANTVEDAQKYRNQANAYFISSMAVGAAGIGTLTYGIVVDGDRVMPTIHVRW
jgi:hypothetical protein